MLFIYLLSVIKLYLCLFSSVRQPDECSSSDESVTAPGSTDNESIDK